jgi:hypothetical protein
MGIVAVGSKSDAVRCPISFQSTDHNSASNIRHADYWLLEGSHQGEDWTNPNPRGHDQNDLSQTQRTREIHAANLVVSWYRGPR